MDLNPFDVSCLYLLHLHENLLLKLVELHGAPVDSYWNGSHTFFSEYEDNELEWRIHPVKGFKMPEGARPEELFDLALEKEIDVTHYWEGLEVFTFDETTLTPEMLAEHCASELGANPDAFGKVDHEYIAQEFERSDGEVSIVQLLLKQMNTSN